MIVYMYHNTILFVTSLPSVILVVKHLFDSITICMPLCNVLLPIGWTNCPPQSSPQRTKRGGTAACEETTVRCQPIRWCEWCHSLQHMLRSALYVNFCICMYVIVISGMRTISVLSSKFRVKPRLWAIAGYCTSEWSITGFYPKMTLLCTVLTSSNCKTGHFHILEHLYIYHSTLV